MIYQLARVRKQKTDDDFYEISASVGTDVWVIPKTADIKKFLRRGAAKPVYVMSIQIQGSTHFIPVELLDFTNTFKEEQ